MGVVYPQQSEDLLPFFEQYVLLRKYEVGEQSLNVSVIFLAPKERWTSSTQPCLVSFDLLTYEKPHGLVKEWQDLTVEEFFHHVDDRCYQYHTASHRSSEEWKVLSQLYDQANQALENLFNML